MDQSGGGRLLLLGLGRCLSIREFLCGGSREQGGDDKSLTGSGWDHTRATRDSWLFRTMRRFYLATQSIEMLAAPGVTHGTMVVVDAVT